MIEKSTAKAKPFLKWAGGKGQLLETIDKFLPQELKQGQIETYIEPFVGSGAVFFHIAQSYRVKNFYLLDINQDLILAYQTIQKYVETLIAYLEEIQQQYRALEQEARKKYYYEMRSHFNKGRLNFDYSNYSDAWIARTAQLIFLNKTCFNGLFRVNSGGEFNVPAGRYKNPTICNRENLQAVAEVLQKAQISCGDFTNCEQWANSHSFVYFDPPYKPISKTARFTAYSSQGFDDLEQLRLKNCFDLLNKQKAKLMLSNSDPNHADNVTRSLAEGLSPEPVSGACKPRPCDGAGSLLFFDDAYGAYRIKRVKASRKINCKKSDRTAINELLIINYY